MDTKNERVDLWYELAKERFLSKAQSSLLAFTAATKKDFDINWHHRVMCRELMKMVRGETKRLMIFMPPRHGKTELVSRRLPAYILGVDPNASIISTSYGADLASRINRDVQRIIEDPEYRKIFPETGLWGKNIRSVADGSYLRNSDTFEVVGHKGIYRSTGIGGGITGMGANYAIIDDPIKNQEEANSKTYRDKVWDWYTSTLYTRLEKNASLLVTMTRWHEDDLAGRILEHSKGNGQDWRIINFPAIKEDDLNPDDTRQLEEPLWPRKYDRKALDSIRATVGTRVWTSLYQQRPAPSEGEIVKRGWWKYYKVIPNNISGLILSADLTFKDGEKTDFAVFQIWGKVGADKYLLDQVRARMGFNDQLRVFDNLNAKWPGMIARYIEDAANGAALIDTLRAKIPGIIAVRPSGSKVARAEAISPQVEAGNIYLPDPSIAPWVNDYIEEWAMFPNGAHDDQVDATTQAISKMSTAAPDNWTPISITGKSKFYGR